MGKIKTPTSAQKKNYRYGEKELKILIMVKNRTSSNTLENNEIRKTPKREFLQVKIEDGI